MQEEKKFHILSVEDASGETTFFQDGLVYVTDTSKYSEEIEDNFTISKLDNADKGISTEYSEHEALVYAVSLEDLVKGAIESGLMDKLPRKTRYNKLHPRKYE